MDSRDWQRQLHGFARPLAKIVLTVFLGMLVFELVQSLLWPDQSPWQSHAAEVIYAATLASVVGYFALRMHTVLYQQVLEENEKYEKSEETLRRNKEWFRSLTEHGSDLITVIDPKGIILYDSPSIERILGYRPIDRQGKSGFDLVHPEDIPGARSIIERAFQKLGSTHTVAMRVRGLDGRWHVLEATCKAMLDHDGKLRGIINSRDITERKEAEKKLLRSEAKFQTLFESNSDAVMLLDGKSFLDCNKAALAIFGCATREEFCSKHPADLSPLEQPCGTSSMMLANQRIATAMEKGSHRFEWVHKRADTGKTFSADVLLSVMELDGKPVLQATVRDITERKQAHQAIKVLAKFPEQNPHPILRVAQDGTLLYANAASHALLETWHCLPEKPIPEWWRNLVVRALASGQPHTTEVEIGGLVYFFTIVPVADEGYANIYASDITERKQAEATLAESREMLYQIVNNLPQHVFWKDRESNYLGCNQLFAETAGVGEPAAIVGKNDFDLAWKETAELYRADDRTVMETNTPKLDFEERQTRPDGSVLWLRTSKVPLQDRDGKVFGILGIYADITERKQLELKARQLSRLAALGQVIGGIAHELKNPLFILTGRIQMAREKLAHQEYADLGSDLEIIGDVGHRMKTITDRFMTIAKPVPPRQEQCSVQAILHNSLESLAHELTQNRIRVETAFAPDLPGIQSDPQQLYEVFLNLMQNAVQTMTHVPGERRLTVSAAHEGTWVVARIQDNGPGIAPEHRAKLFEPFFSTAEQGKAPGLGLWIARSTLMMLKGEVLCESEVGKGTTFVVRLPVST